MKEPKVLIVDDENLLLELLTESFTKHEIQNEKAKQGLEHEKAKERFLA